MRRNPGVPWFVLLILAACARPVPDFNFTLNPGGEAKQGETLELPLTITRLGGFNKKLTVVLEAPPAGISASPAVIQPEGKGVSLFVQIDKATPPADGLKLKVKVSGEGLTNPKTKEYTLKVLQGFDFSLSPTPASLSLSQAGKASVKLDIVRSAEFSEAMVISVGGLPAGVSVAPATLAPGSGAGSVDLNFEATAVAEVVKDQNLTITAVGQGISKTTALKLTVVEPFKLEVSDPTLTIGQGGSKEITISAVREGFAGAIPLTLTGLPPKVTVSPANLSIPSGQNSSKATLLVEPTASVLSNQTLTVSGSAIGLTKSKTFVLNIGAVPPDFDFALTPSPLNLNQGGSVGLTVTATRNPTLIGDITVSLPAAGVPAGVSADPLTIPAGQTQGDLTFKATLDAEVSTEREVSVSATAQGVTKTKTFKLNVLAVTGYTFALSPADLVIEKPTAGTKTAITQINLTRTVFTDAVSLSVLGAPTGASASFNPASLSGPTLSSTLTLSVDPSATAQNDSYTLTIRASGSGGRQVDQTLNLKIVDLAITAANLTAVRAETTALGFNLNRIGFSGDVQVALTGLPAGVSATSPITVSGSGGSFALSVAKDAVIPAAPVALTLTATASAVPGLSRTTSLNLTLKPQFEIVLHQGTLSGPVVSAVSLQQGDNNFPNNLIWVEVKRNGNYSKAVFLRALSDTSVLEVGQTASSGQGLFPTEVTGNASVFRFAVKPMAGLGTYNFAVEAVQLDSAGPVLDESVKARADLSFTVTSPFSISLGSSAGSINQGGTTDLVVNVTRNVPFSGPITLSASDLPVGVVAPNVVIPAGASSGVLVLSASETATVGAASPLTISASAALGVQYTQIVSKSAPYSLSVNPKPAVNFSFDPPSLTLNPTAGASGSKSVTVNLTRTNFGEAVTVFVDPSSLPGQVTTDTNPKIIAAGENSVGFTLIASAGAPSQVFNAKFIVSGSGIAVVSKDLPVTVTLGP